MGGVITLVIQYLINHWQSYLRGFIFWLYLVLMPSNFDFFSYAYITVALAFYPLAEIPFRLVFNWISVGWDMLRSLWFGDREYYMPMSQLHRLFLLIVRLFAFLIPWMITIPGALLFFFVLAPIGYLIQRFFDPL